MKAIIFAAYYAPHVGGYCKNIHELSRRLVERGHEVIIVTCNTENAVRFEKKDGVVIARLPAWDILNKSFPIPKPTRMLREIFNQKPDVVLTQTRFFTTSLVGAIFAITHHIPLIHVERGTVHTVTGKLVSVLAQVYDHTLGTFVVKTAVKNVGVSQAACNFIEHIGGKNTEVIYNGIDVC